MDADSSWIIKSLKGAADTSRHCEVIAGMVKDHKFAALESLAAALESGQAGQRWAVESVVENIERSLAFHPSLDAVKSLLRLASTPRIGSVQNPRKPASRTRQLASMLGFAQPFDVLGQIVKDACLTGLEELIACWVQEHLIRHGSIPEETHVSTFWSQLAVEGHPLSVLPLQLLSTESGLAKWMPSYGPRGGSQCSMPFGSNEESGVESAIVDFGIIIEGPLTVPDDLTRPFAAWLEESNGVVDARAWSIKEDAVVKVDLTDSILQLDVPALVGASVENVDFGEALGVLFSGAIDGGAHGADVQGAYARLFAWNSVAGFMRREFTDLDHLDTPALDSTWFLFDAASSWFEQVAWDVGIVCIPPDRRSLTLLAATDTD